MAVCICFASVEIQAQPSQDFAAQLLADDPATRTQAIMALATMDVDEVGDDVRQAVIRLLERLNGIRAERDRATAVGESLEPSRTLDDYLAVIRVATRLGDARAIPVLIGSFGTGLNVPEALSRFGDTAFEFVLAAVNDPATYHHVWGALSTFRYMIVDDVPLTQAQRGQIKEATRKHLTVETDFPSTLRAAIDLTVTLNDPELIEIVESLATSRQEIIARGIDDPAMIEDIQQHAIDAIRGDLPPLPRFRLQ